MNVRSCSSGPNCRKSTLYLYWIGEFYPAQLKTSTETIKMPPSRNVLTIGHGPVKSLLQIPYEDEENEPVNFPDVALFSCMRQLLLTGAHATISRKPDDSFVIFDDGRFETLVNYERIVTEVALKEKDVICFGHPFDATIQPVQLSYNFVACKDT
ncbi:hypothetical protein Aperf_G00000057515 [Anoplocephala perfoliata]